MLLCRCRTYTTFRLLVRMLYLEAIGDSSVVTRGYSEKFRELLCRNRTYDLLITSSDAQPLSYGRLLSGDSEILGKTRVLLCRCRTYTTFRLLVRVLYLLAIGDLSVVTRGYSEKSRELLCNSRTYNRSFRLLVRMPLSLRAFGDSSVVTWGYSEKFRELLCKSRTYDRSCRLLVRMPL